MEQEYNNNHRKIKDLLKKIEKYKILIVFTICVIFGLIWFYLDIIESTGFFCTFVPTCFTAFAVIFLEFLVEKVFTSESEKMKDDCIVLSDFQRKIVDNFMGKSCNFCYNNITAIKEGRPIEYMEELFKSAENSISILATNLDSFQFYVDPIFFDKIKDGKKVNILALHPKYATDFVKSRNLEDAPAQTLEMMKLSLSIIYNKRESIINDIDEDNFQMKLFYGIAPSMIIIIIDAEYVENCKCCVGYLLNTRKSRDTIHFTYSGQKDNSLVKGFIDHFQSIWNDDKHTITVDQLLIDELN